MQFQNGNRHSTLVNRQYASSCVKFNECYAMSEPEQLLDALNREIFEVSHGSNCIRTCVFDCILVSHETVQTGYLWKNINLVKGVGDKNTKCFDSKHNCLFFTASDMVLCRYQ